MYLHLGQSVVVPFRDVVGIFDLDNTTGSHITRQFLRQAEQNGRTVTVSEELPKSFVLCAADGAHRVYISQISTATLQKRTDEQNLSV